MAFFAMAGADLAPGQTSMPEAGSRLGEQWKEHNARGRGPGHPADRLVENQKALEIARRGVEQEPTSVAWLNALWVSYLAMGELQGTLGEWSDALVSLNEGKAVVERLAEIEPANTRWQEATAMFWSAIGRVSPQDDKDEAGLSALQSELAIRRRLAEATPSDARARTELMYSLNNLGSEQLKLRRFADAEKSYREALVISEQTGTDTRRQQDVRALIEENVGVALLAQGQAQAALTYFEKSLVFAERSVTDAPKDIVRVHHLGRSQDLMGHAFQDQGDLERAEQFFRMALATHRRALSLQPQNPFWLIHVANGLGALGGLLAQQGRIDESRECFRQGRDLVQRLGAPPDWFDEQLSKLN